MSKVFKCCKDVIISAPGYVIINILILICVSFAQIGISYFMGVLVQSISSSFISAAKGIGIPIIGFAICICIGGNTSNINELLCNLFVKKSKKRIYNIYIGKIMSEKHDSFLNSAFMEELAFAKTNIESTTNVSIKFFNKLLGSVLTVIIACSAIAYVDKVILILILVQALLLMVINKYIVLRKISINRRYIADERKAEYFKNLLTSKKECKEVFAYRLQDFFIDKWEAAFSSYSESKSEFQVKTQVLLLIPSLLRQLSIILLTIYYLDLMNMQLITIEEFVFINGSMWILVNHINKLVSIVTRDLKEDIEKVRKFYDFMDSLVKSGDTDKSILNENLQYNRIELKNVSYTYPNQSKAALHNVNLSIRKGQIISILGHNGSGKSTLAKILCGSLEDYSGNIYIDGVNIKEVGKSEFSSLWGIGFQDFNRFSFSLLENIQIGFIEKKDDAFEAQKAIDKSGLQGIINKMPDGVNTILGKEYDRRGQELSGGEWQRITLARAYMGEHPIIIMDEPTAAIDPIEEYYLLEGIREKIRSNTAILISHRIGFAKLADYIVVMKEGTIVEEGTHDILISRQGEYYKMFNAQRQLYEGKKVEK